MTDDPPAGARPAPAPEAGIDAPALQPASLARRLAALGYEGLLLAAVVLAAGFAFAPLVSPPDPGDVHMLRIPSPAARALLFAALFAVGSAYFGWSWSGGRRTLPLKTWRMRLVRRDGGTLPARTALLRYAAAWIGPAAALAADLALAPTGHRRWAACLLAVNYAWALVDRDRAFLHDRIAGTRIVVDPRR